MSATSRAPRGEEQNGKEYFFLSKEEFEKRIAAGEFVEYEEVYKGFYYGTLKSEVERIWSEGHITVFDIDVVGCYSNSEILPLFFKGKDFEIVVMTQNIEPKIN